MKIRILLLCCVLSLFVSCRDEHVMADNDLYHTWGSPVIFSVESMAYPKDVEGPIVLTFKRDGSYLLKLEVNSCPGSFENPAKDSIRIGTPGCTEMCCDSKFAQKLVTMLPKVTSYIIEDNTLQLQVPQWGFMELKLVE